MDATTGLPANVIVQVLTIVGLPGFIAWLWAQDRKNISKTLDGMAAALNLLAGKVGEAVESSRNHRG